MIRVLIADDHALVRQALTLALQSTGDIRVVAQAASGEEARQRVREQQPDVVLMDLSMPGMGGVEATRRLRDVRPPVRVLGLSQFVKGPYVQRFLQAGGTGYVSKYAAAEQLVQAVRRTAAGECFLSPEVAAEALPDSPEAGAPSRRDQLTRRELQVLQLLARGLAPLEVAATLFLSVKTVAHHRRRLLAKFKVSNDVQLINEAHARGLVDATA